jgi:SAM-dependent methyltransferase
MICEAQKLDTRGLDLEFRAIRSAEEALRQESCDAILCSSVIEYVVDPDALLLGFGQALRRPGLLIISYANRSSLWRRYSERGGREANPMYAPHNWRWNWREFRKLLARNGFRPTLAPKYFESPLDWKRWGYLFRNLSLAGSLGLVAARPEPRNTAR